MVSRISAMTGLGAFLPLVSTAMAFDSVRLVKDVADAPPRGSLISQVYAHGNEAYFVADTPIRLRTLWGSDGTQAGTQLVFPFGSGDDVQRIVQFGDRFLSYAWFDGYGNELGIFDPATGTNQLLKDTNPGPASGFLQTFVVAGELCYFQSYNPEIGVEFWRTDGTEAGTHLVAEIVPGPSGVSINGLYPIAAFGDKLIAFVDDGNSGSEPWLIDGVSGQVSLVRDIRPGSASSILTSSAAVSVPGHVVFIAAGEPDFRYELWGTDGTEAGTIPLTSGANLNFSDELVRVGDYAYIIVRGDSIGERLLLRTDGTLEGTTYVDLSPTGLPSNVNNMTAFGNELAMMALFGSNNYELWLTDFTAGNTRRIASGLNSGTLEPFPRTPSGHTYFAASTNGEGMELWITDGTQAGTRLVRDINPGATGSFRNAFLRKPDGELIYPGVTIGEQVFFYPNDGVHGDEPWVSDGTAEGTQLLRDIWPQDGAAPWSLRSAGDRIYFTASDAAAGSELWVSDGTDAGTHMTRDVRPGPNGAAGALTTSAVVDGRFYCELNDGTNGREVWGTDGSEAGTSLVSNIGAGNASANVEFLGEFDGRLVILAERGVYLSDGTPATTQLAIPVPTGGFLWSAMLPGSGAWDGLLLIAATIGDSGNELWLGDLQTGALTPLADINAGPGDSAPELFARFGDRVLFSATTPATGRELWITNGTPGGTGPVADIRPGTAGSTPTGVAVLTSRVLFFADDGVAGYEPWTTDGTPQGTARVTDIYPGPTGSYANSTVRALNGVAYFAAMTPELGIEAWRSDGTPAGTAVLRDIQPGSHSSRADRFTVHGTHIYFVAEDDVAGRELWRTDGTPAGTLRVADITPGPGSSLGYDPDLFASAGDALFFAANDGRHGQELWVLEPATSPDIDGDGQVGLQDLASLLAAFGTCAGDARYTLSIDLNGDGCVELADLAQLLAAFGS